MSLLPFDLPATFLSYASRSEQWAAWIDGVPRLTRNMLDEWDLVVDGPPLHGHTALVVPVNGGGRDAVLKVA